jgi:hypothetical protein
MSAYTHLIAHRNSRPAGPTSSGKPNYKETDILAWGKSNIPILWMTLFTAGDIRTLETEEGDLPSPVTSSATAKARWAERKGLIAGVFPHNPDEIAIWDGLLARVQAPYVKVDVDELWAMDPDGFEEELRRSLNWFESQSADDFRELLANASVEYDATSRTIDARGLHPGVFFYGRNEGLPTWRDS